LKPDPKHDTISQREIGYAKTSTKKEQNMNLSCYSKKKDIELCMKLRNLKAVNGVSIRQLMRITGVSKFVIEKA